MITKLRTKLSKIDILHHQYMAKSDPSSLSDRIGSPVSQEKKNVPRLRDPLIAELRK